MQRVGLISDTHGLLRSEAMDALRGSDHIIHAGDICNADILKALTKIAPVTAVRGNNDIGDWAKALPEEQRLQFENVLVYVLHDIKELDLSPEAEGISVVIAGHSHKPCIEKRDNVFYINPGSAGPRRFKLPIAVAELVIDGATFTSQIIHLE